MTAVFAILAVALLGVVVAILIKNKKLENEVTKTVQESERLRQQSEAEISRISYESQTTIIEAQRLVDQHAAEMKDQSEHIRQHYHAEALKAQEAANALVATTIAELQPLRKYEKLRDAEAEAKQQVAEALTASTDLVAEARTLLERAREAASEERSQEVQRAKELRAQAEALLDQATREAGRIVADANKRAEQIAGEAYIALRDNQLLERAAVAIRNVIDGYGDRYVVPTRSLLDELAADFGHTAAGEALGLAREQSRRMVEQGVAATCDYVESERRETAIRFVIDAFNGRVDGILSRTKHDNYGTLQQEIQDAFSLVNLNGNAFKNARILPTYLDARLAELKWGVVAQELRLKEREEQRRIQEQIREEEKARKEYERAIRDAAKEQEILRHAMDKAQQQIQQATEEQKTKYEEQLQELAGKLKEAQERNQRAISMAQQTRRGHVYIISNIGSLGENMYKIGLTRRLEPLERISELGDSSVPFEFDVHALIFSEDAPALERKLHKHFAMAQVNKVNFRKEFFRVDLNYIREEINKLGITPKWTMIAEAAEYRESLAIEDAIKKDPVLRDSWLKRQFQLELLNEELEENSKEQAEQSPRLVERDLQPTSAHYTSSSGI
jgi:hypothetical protein